jgi:hypothetical protein
MFVEAKKLYGPLPLCSAVALHLPWLARMNPPLGAWRDVGFLAASAESRNMYWEPNSECGTTFSSFRRLRPDDSVERDLGLQIVGESPTDDPA